MVIGITGGSGSGKSTVANFLLETTNSYIIEADEVFLNLLKDEKFTQKIKKLLPENIQKNLTYLNVENYLQKDRENYKKYQNIIKQKIESEIIKNLKENDNDFKIIVDTFLLERKNIKKQCDYIISIITPEWQRIQRLMKRDNISIEDAVNRVNIQKDLNYYINNTNFTVSNSMDGMEDLEENLINALSQLFVEDENKQNKKNEEIL